MLDPIVFPRYRSAWYFRSLTALMVQLAGMDYASAVDTCAFVVELSVLVQLRRVLDLDSANLFFCVFGFLRLACSGLPWVDFKAHLFGFF